MSAPRLDLFADLIEPFQRRGVDLGLERLATALAELDHPERRFVAVQVAGTNGKGSISALVHGALVAAGLRSGLYTSPHLLSWCERIRLGAEPIAPAVLRRWLTELQPLARRHNLTPFELITAAAFAAFAEAGVAIAVLEVGLGGRLDATTVHPRREVIALASIGLDHREFLGPDLASIAAEKAGVLHPGALVVSGPQTPEVRSVLEAQAQARGCRLQWLEPLEQQGDELVAGDLRWPSALPGAVQRLNGAVALGVIENLRRLGWAIPDQAICAGFSQVHWPGRLQRVLWRGHPLILDGAHNPPAAVALRSERDRLGDDPIHWVIGILTNKQAPEMLQALLAPRDRAWIVPVGGHSSWGLPELLAACPELAHQLTGAKDPEAALIEATGTTRSPNRPVIVAGSLYLLGDLLASADLDQE
ncbi:folylpolyglutamate synthase/dihydrofolate synthase family protein [Cyanobium sp. Morenito 9A2]|uniref:bifunctional folylpolyglutamate synthase/dihydrofolate synthase n=1 Tax=Cyanobium sp. Morenito 9A2 TaxID=2823718 RepID=UPI0020CBC411|nr:bifunctional folylpolyglutamate synthase/dihydrofolate synthase [Cyanobium sp. Morenito 9A2]MCP9848232.1 bifunctional folylpolyglutamate synthase/dihydrofolate synthase [Cyanobium sp. Morenito 9A2]